MVSTTAGGRLLKSTASRPGTTHGVSTDLDTGAMWCRAPERGDPLSEECAREVLSQGKWVQETRSGWAKAAQPAGPSPRPPWACSMSVRPAMCQCVRAEGALGQGKYSWRWEDSSEANRFTWASPNWLQSSQIVSGRCHSPGNVSWSESASAARLNFPGMWTVRSDLNCVWLQRRRWRPSCDMRCDRIPPNRLIYETTAVLSMRTSMCLPNSSGRNCRKARSTALGSWCAKAVGGPVQSPEAACLLHVAPQPVLEVSVVTTVCRDTCSRISPARRKARSVQGLRERRHCLVIFTRSIPWRHAHLGNRECSQCWSGLIWSNPSGVTAAVDAICPRSLWNCFSGTKFLPLKELMNARPWGVLSYSPSLTPHRKEKEKIYTLLRGELAIFPVDPKPLLAEVLKHQVPVIAQLLSGSGQVRPIVEIIGDPGAHFP